MRSLGLAIMIIFGVGLTLDDVGPIDLNYACEDEHGNTFFLPLERYQTSMRPVGPCLPVGTWSALREGRFRPVERREGNSRGQRDP